MAGVGGEWRLYLLEDGFADWPDGFSVPWGDDFL